MSILNVQDIANNTKKIAILYGGGSADAIPNLLQTAELLKAPLVHTTRSKDLLDNSHPYYVGGIGLMGSKPGNYAVQQCRAKAILLLVQNLKIQTMRKLLNPMA